MKLLVDFILTLEQHCQFYNFIKSIKFPDSLTSNLSKNVTNNDNKISGLKLHDYHVIMQHFFVVGIQPFLKKSIS